MITSSLLPMESYDVPVQIHADEDESFQFLLNCDDMFTKFSFIKLSLLSNSFFTNSFPTSHFKFDLIGTRCLFWPILASLFKEKQFKFLFLSLNT